MDLRGEQKAERRERILDSARRMIGDAGYDALTMRDLARAARVTVPTIYNLIGGKEAVLFAAIEEQTADFLESIDTAENPSPASRALAVVDSCTRELLRLPSYYRTLLSLLLTSETAREMRFHVDAALTGELERALVEMRAAGDLAAWADVPTLARSLTSQLQFTSVRWAGGELDAKGLCAAAVYDAGLMLLAVATGSSRAELASRVERAQDQLARLRRRRKHRRSGGGADRRSGPAASKTRRAERGARR